MKLYSYFDLQTKQWGLPFASLNAFTASRDLMKLANREELEEGFSFTKRDVQLWYLGEWDPQLAAFVEKPKKRINWIFASENIQNSIAEEDETKEEEINNE